MSLAILFHFLCAQHVSDINISIIRSLWLFCWITTLVVLFLFRCVLDILCGWVGVVSVSQASACNTYNRTPLPPTAALLYHLKPHSPTTYSRTPLPPTTALLYHLQLHSPTTYSRTPLPPTAVLLYHLQPHSPTTYSRTPLPPTTALPSQREVSVHNKRL